MNTTENAPVSTGSTCPTCGQWSDPWGDHRRAGCSPRKQSVQVPAIPGSVAYAETRLHVALDAAMGSAGRKMSVELLLLQLLSDLGIDLTGPECDTHERRHCTLCFAPSA